MDFGIGLLCYEGCWDDAAFAESHGFTHAWFTDSPLVGAEQLVCLTLAAARTSTIKLGPCVAVPSSRIAPVAAQAIASINLIAPGRLVLGVGSGFTARNMLGMPPVPVAAFREYVEQCRGLLAGQEVRYREGTRESWIRFANPRRPYLNIDDPIEVFVAGIGPRALQIVADLADGWVTYLGFSDYRTPISSLAPSRKPPYVVATTNACVLQPGESVLSERVIERTGPMAAMTFHSIWENRSRLDWVSPAVRDAYPDYEARVIRVTGTTEDRLRAEVHEGHMIYLRPGEREFLTEELLRANSLIGTADELVTEIRRLESIGIDNVSLWPPPHTVRATIEEFAREVMGRV